MLTVRNFPAEVTTKISKLGRKKQKIAKIHEIIKNQLVVPNKKIRKKSMSLCQKKSKKPTCVLEHIPHCSQRYVCDRAETHSQGMVIKGIYPRLLNVFMARRVLWEAVCSQRVCSLLKLIDVATLAGVIGYALWDAYECLGTREHIVLALSFSFSGV